MGRDASGVQGMRLRAGDEVIAVNIAHDDADVLVVTENGYGKRTPVRDYPVKGRGGLGVKTVQLTEAKGQLAGSRVVRDGYQVMLISDGGTVIKMSVDDIKRSGRSTQGVIVMRLREGEHVSTLAPVVESGGQERGHERSRSCPAEPSERTPQISLSRSPQKGEILKLAPSRIGKKRDIPLKQGVPAHRKTRKTWSSAGR